MPSYIPAPVVRRSTLALLLALVGCGPGESREFIGPPPNSPSTPLARVVVTPSVGIVAPDESLQLAAFGVSTTGDSIGVTVGWSASGGTISPAGRFTSTTPGTYHIIARSLEQPDKADSAAIAVLARDNEIVAVTVAPKAPTAEPGGAVQFTGTVEYLDGSTSGEGVFWIASGGSIDGSGLYIAGDQPGDFAVIGATANGHADTAVVRIRSTVVLTDLIISPSGFSVEPHGVQPMTVTAIWSDGSSAVPALDWSSDGGTIDAHQVFTASGTPGSYRIIATVRGGGLADTALVSIEAPQVVALTIAPNAASLTPGATQHFTALATLSDGQVLTASPAWTATGGTITSQGGYTAGAVAGTFRVIATDPSGIADTVAVVIANPPVTLTGLLLNPSAVTLSSGDAQQFVVTATWSDGSTRTPSVSWAATGGTITGAGSYLAGTVPGTYRVVATHAASGKADTSVVTLQAPRLTGLDLTPNSGSIVEGGTIQFAVSGTMSDGSTVVPAVSYTAAGGTITAGGLYTAGQATGTFRVIAADQGTGIADTSLVTVTSPPVTLVSLAISPTNVTLGSRQVQVFGVVGTWSDGSTSVPSVTWTATGGTISSSGRYTAGNQAGTYRVIARETGGTVADTVPVVVTGPPPVLTAIVVSPGTASLQPGGSKTFSVAGVWTNGGSGTPAVTWSSTGGIVNSSGTYTAGSAPGTYVVKATQVGGSLTDSAIVTVSGGPPQLIGVVVTPDSASVQAGNAQQYAVDGVWTNGGSGAPAVAWTATGGSVTGTGLYTAGSTPGVYRVVATQQGGTLADTVVVTVTAQPNTLLAITVVPDSTNTTTATTSQFTVTGTWSSGSGPVPQVTWSATGGTINGSGRYTAGSNPGTYRVIARQVGGSLADTAKVLVVSPVLLTLTIAPPTATVAAGATQQFTSSGTWSDGQARPVAVVYTATGGTVTSGGLYTAGNTGGTFRVVATCSCGLADTAQVTVTPPVVPVLTAIAISPATISLQTGATQQFTVTPTWINGVGTLPPIVYTATGGSISTGGNYTAGSTAGSYRVIAQVQGVSLADTAAVTILPPPPPPPPPGGSPTVTLATYYGGSDVEQLRDAAFDPAGGWCVAGNTKSPNFKTTAGAAQSTFAGFSDATVTCFNANGSLRAATMVGGPNYEKAYAMAIAPNGDIYIAGRAGAGLPKVAGGAQSTFAGGPSSSVYGVQDGFVCRLNHALTQVIQCTYVGGGDDGAIRDMTVAPDGTVYWAGWYGGSGSPLNPAWTAGAYRASPIGARDGTVGRLTSDLGSMICASYTGGTDDEAGEPSVLALADGSIVEARISRSADAAGTPALKGISDMLMTRLSPDCRTLIWARRLGGTQSEFAETQTLALIADGRIVAAFGTLSFDFPMTAGHAQPSNAGNASSSVTGANSNYPGDCVVTVVRPDGTLEAATYLGSRDGDGCQGTGVDGSSIVVSGSTYGTNFPVTTDAWLSARGGGSDGFIARLPFDLSRITYASYLGGTEGRCAAASLGQMLGCGMTDVTIQTVSPVQAARGGNTDGYVIRFSVP